MLRTLAPGYAAAADVLKLLTGHDVVQACHSGHRLVDVLASLATMGLQLRAGLEETAKALKPLVLEGKCR